MSEVATGDIGHQLKITILCLVATLYWFITAWGMKGKASWWGDGRNKYIKTIWDYKVINVAPRTNDHNCLMPNHPFHTQFYEQASLPFTAFLLLRQTGAVVRGPNSRYKIHKLWGATGHFKPSVAATAFFLLSTWKKLIKETPAGGFFLLSHSQTVGTVLLLSGKLCLTHPNCNREKFPTVFSPPQKYFQWLKDILLQVKASFWCHHNLLHISDALPKAYSRLGNESTTLWTRAPRHTQKHAAYPLFITTA